MYVVNGYLHSGTFFFMNKFFYVILYIRVCQRYFFVEVFLYTHTRKMSYGRSTKSERFGGLSSETKCLIVIRGQHSSVTWCKSCLQMLSSFCPAVFSPFLLPLSPPFSRRVLAGRVFWSIKG